MESSKAGKDSGRVGILDGRMFYRRENDNTVRKQDAQLQRGSCTHLTETQRRREERKVTYIEAERYKPARYRNR